MLVNTMPQESLCVYFTFCISVTELESHFKEKHQHIWVRIYVPCTSIWGGGCLDFSDTAPPSPRSPSKPTPFIPRGQGTLLACSPLQQCKDYLSLHVLGTSSYVRNNSENLKAPTKQLNGSIYIKSSSADVKAKKGKLTKRG